MAEADIIRRKLEDRFAPVEIEVIDESESHRGHAGWREGGGTHFRVRMVAAAFDGQSRIARQRAVHRALAAELEAPEGAIHALALELRGAAEAG